MNVAWGAEDFLILFLSKIGDWKPTQNALRATTLCDLKVRRAIKGIKAGATKRREEYYAGNCKEKYLKLERGSQQNVRCCRDKEDKKLGCGCKKRAIGTQNILHDRLREGTLISLGTAMDHMTELMN